MNDGDAQSTDGAREWDLEPIEFTCFVSLIVCAACWWALTLAMPRERSYILSTHSDAETIRQAVYMFHVENSEAVCPSVARLKHGQFLTGSLRMADAWGNAFRITCDGRDVHVVSAGQDELFGTGDDIY